MPRYFALADALLVSLRDEPIFACTVPSKLQSYLACGKPVIAALRGDGAQLVFDAKAGLVANPESPESLADAVLKMQQLSQLERGAMGLRGRDYFEKHFSHPVILERLEKILQETAQTSG
jgi:colanic acid biosynthesis glycosyl transferase WcaI